MNVIEIEGIYKSYDDAQVLRGLDLRLPRGMVYGLLGPNGSGKTTLIYLMLGFLKPERGVIRLLGSSQLQRIDGRVGYVPERLRYHTRYTAREYLTYLGQFADLSGPTLRRRVQTELAAVGLAAVADRQLSTFSRGMLQRVGIAQALLSDPEVLLIDEPTSGLDPGGQHEVVALLDAVRDRGCTVFMATHFLDEAELLCDRIGVLHGGRIVAETDIEALRGPGGSVAIVVDRLSSAVAEALQALSPAIQCDAATVAIAPNTPALQSQALRLLLDHGVTVLRLTPRQRPIEEFYLRAVRGELSQSHPPVAAPPETPEPLAVQPGRPSGTGDTLLRELLRREERHERDGDEPDTTRS